MFIEMFDKLGVDGVSVICINMFEVILGIVYMVE